MFAGGVMVYGGVPSNTNWSDEPKPQVPAFGAGEGDRAAGQHRDHADGRLLDDEEHEVAS